ncbi:ROK family protein [Vibrio sp. 404]|uniref:ROK family protein n=1 Tax=Vibrio marinisediminis TaxID=2758441 RepID=A0A7W2FSN9_9VIBR|nr:ROK family protein [Vibrio marinisediminis]MBA5763563.1 ROK family protein [Vibrio marinisediminis]
MVYLALDFGGSAVKGAIMDAQANIFEKFSLPSRVKSFEDWFALFDPVFMQLQENYRIQGIAISACGAVETNKGLVYGASSLHYIHGVDVKTLFSQRYHLPVEIENDACCAALAESWIGNQCDSNNICLVVIGSGVGGALIVDGKLCKGHHLYGGEFGYAILGFSNGCPQVVSELASTQGLIVQAAKRLNVPRQTLDGKKVFELYQSGDADIADVVDKWVGYLATTLFNLQYTLDPEYIVLGGAISQQAKLIPLIEQKFAHYTQAMPFCHITPQVVASKFGNDANLVGAVAHYIQCRHG